ncbi:MAG TPA: mannose-1-phosphate guanylyltransferase [Paludibacteraceae bacterium]|nr:mannose-1-phosphate guanylyltransferase [Bacteroidales bacterium]HOH55343.1 mannose-1-phosphate guanylyltransferase [Paludibacteraceae bacterium]
MEQNYCVIMAGGIGSRFWPFSRKDRPKQFLDFFGTGRSLLQLTFDRFRHLIPVENILIVSNELYKDLILEQLPEIGENQLLLEPVRRNTAPCIAYAVYKIKSITNNANIIVTPSDHLILKETEFLDTIRQGLNFISKNNSLLTLGIKPSRPETGYGYIQIEPGDSNLRKVKTFTEKPNADLAKIFFESGEFFWNSGIFMWNLKTILSAFDFHLPDISSKFKEGERYFNTPEEKTFIEEIFHTCRNISIDYGIMEKAQNVYVLCSDFGWTDLGTWGSLYEMSPKDEKGNVSLKCKTMFYESSNNIVSMSPEKLAVVQDLNDYIIADSDNVLLICKREDEQQIRQFVKDASILFDGKYD